MPVYTGLSIVACFSNLGLPGLAGFIGEVNAGAGAAALITSVAAELFSAASRFRSSSTAQLVACSGGAIIERPFSTI